jgi:hypothetical protein
MYVDPQASGVPYKYMNSPDLNSWSAMITLAGSSASVVRHGTILRDTTYGITSIESHDALAPLPRNTMSRTGMIINGRFDHSNKGLQDALGTENPVVYYRLDGRKLPIFPGILSSEPCAAKMK